MVETVAEVMTDDPIVLDAQARVSEAAKLMRDGDIGDVIVTRNGRVAGVVTDRDIVVRAVASELDPSKTRVDEISSSDPTTIAPTAPLDDAVRVMRERAIRRLPVVEGDRPVGILSLGDLAIDRDPRSLLADITKAAPNA
jgi:CBS domain-containing protein